VNPSASLSTTRAIWLIARLALRRQLNILQRVRWRRRRKREEALRAGTPTKAGRRSIFGGFLFVVMIFNGFFIGSRGLASISAITRNLPEAPDKFVVSAFTYSELLDAQQAMRQVERIEDPVERAKLEELWNRHIDRLFTTEVRWGAFSEDGEGARLRQMRERFAREGAGGFARPASDFFAVSSTTWPRVGAAKWLFVRALGLLLALLTPTLVFISLGTNNKDLGQVEWIFEWLYTFPVSGRALFASRLFVYSFLNQFVWWLLFPFAVLMYVAGGFGWAAIFPGFAVTLYLAVVAGAITLLAEVALRKTLSAGRIKNTQALFTVAGSIFLLFTYAAILFKPVGSLIVRAAASMPTALIWNPLSVPLIPAIPGVMRWQVQLSVCAVIAVAVAAVSLALLGGEWLTRDGLIKAGGPYESGNRRIRSPGLGGRWLRGISAQEVLLLARDRNLFVQVFIVPLLMPAFYLLADSSLRSALTGNLRRAAMVTYAVGALSFLSSAMPLLGREDKTLWQLLSFPRSLVSILFEKALFWAVAGLLYGGAILIILRHFGAHSQVTSWSYVILALYGIVLYAFIASGLGILTTNVLEAEARTQMSHGIVYLYFLLAAMYTNSFYTSSPWTALAQLVLSTLLAVALWQKVEDLCPFLLDPTQWPPRTIGLADGLIAALAFFVLQGLMAMLLLRASSTPFPEQITIAYIAAGLIVATVALFIFWMLGISGLWEQIGLVPKNDKTGPLAGLIQGAFWGAAAALGAITYVRALNLFPQWQIWKEDAELSSFVSRAHQPLWICALLIVAAPVVEEFLFRGLIFQGLRRSAGWLVAALGSAGLFALVHPPIAVIPVFGLGIAAAISFETSGFLWAAIVTHAMYNACILSFNPGVFH
jgi:ABC-2 type transport system permease protein